MRVQAAGNSVFGVFNPVYLALGLCGMDLSAVFGVLGLCARFGVTCPRFQLFNVNVIRCNML